jgi:cytochrome P450
MGTVAPFDHHSAEHAADPAASYRALREQGRAVHTDRHGGYTVFPGYAEIAEITRDHETFSSALVVPGGEGYGGGITQPHNPKARRMSLAEMDPPDWRRVRHLLNPLFTPRAVEKFADRIRMITHEFIDRFIEAGSCDLVLDLCSPVPGIVTLEYLGLPTGEWEKFSVPVHKSTYTPREPGNPAFEALNADFQWIFEQISAEIDRRRRDPGEGDLVAAMLGLADGSGGLDDDLLFETIYTVLAAGVDTSTSLLSAALLHLDANPDDRRRLMDDPSLLPVACEEFLRYYTPSQAGARTVLSDTEIAGCPLHRGDRVVVAWASGNRDESVFPRPDEFVLDREPNRHLSFGFGIHRCIGAHLARQEFVVLLGEVLRRIPDYTIDRSRTDLYPDVGLMYGYQEMPATFTPGPRVTG